MVRIVAYLALLDLANATYADDLLIKFPLSEQREFAPFHLRGQSSGGQSSGRQSVSHGVSHGVSATAEVVGDTVSDGVDLMLLVSPGTFEWLEKRDFYKHFLTAVNAVSESSRVGLATFSAKPSQPDWTSNATCYHSVLKLTDINTPNTYHETGNDDTSTPLTTPPILTSPSISTDSLSTGSRMSILEQLSEYLKVNRGNENDDRGNQLGGVLESVLHEDWKVVRPSAIVLVTYTAFHWAEDGTARLFKPSLFSTFSDRSSGARCNQLDYPSPYTIKQLLWSKRLYLLTLTVIEDGDTDAESAYHWLSTYLSQPSSFVQPLIHDHSPDPAIRTLIGNFVNWVQTGQVSDNGVKNRHVKTVSAVPVSAVPVSAVPVSAVSAPVSAVSVPVSAVSIPTAVSEIVTSSSSSETTTIVPSSIESSTIGTVGTVVSSTTTTTTMAIRQLPLEVKK